MYNISEKYYLDLLKISVYNITFDPFKYRIQSEIERKVLVVQSNIYTVALLTKNLIDKGRKKEN